MDLQKFIKKFSKTVDAELKNVEKTNSYRNNSPKENRISLNAYRDILVKNRKKIQTIHNDKASGITVCSLLSELVDRFIVHICSVFEIEIKSNDGFAVIALGGYGRNELNPYSDIDLLIILEEKSESVYENRVKAIIQFLWDINLNIGHATHTAAECIEAAKDDSDLSTSLLDARYLTGNVPLWEKFKRHYKKWLLSGAGIAIAKSKIKERNSRLKQYNGKVNIKTPDIKESPGGLRDIHISRWLMMLTGQGNTLQELFDTGLLYDYEIVSYEENFDFLLRVRNARHFTAGKKSETIEHLSLPEIVRNLKYKGTRIQRVERFMCEYYMKTGKVFSLTNHIIGRFLRKFEASGTHELKTDPSGLVIINHKAGFPSLNETFLSEFPGFFVKIFVLAGKYNLDISGYALSMIERNIGKFGENLPLHPEVRTEFFELINMKKGLSKSLRLMHEYGVLSKLIPEFGTISWHYQYNFYHAYTTDEHSIRVVENIEKMDLGILTEVPELLDIMGDVTAKGALYLAGLLHDVGKGKGKKSHSVTGEHMAALSLERLGFDERTIDLVRFLIREHLIMTHISQRRDIDNEDTIKDFVKRVRSTGKASHVDAFNICRSYGCIGNRFDRLEKGTSSQPFS